MYFRRIRKGRIEREGKGMAFGTRKKDNANVDIENDGIKNAGVRKKYLDKIKNHLHKFAVAASLATAVTFSAVGLYTIKDPVGATDFAFRHFTDSQVLYYGQLRQVYIDNNFATKRLKYQLKALKEEEVKWVGYEVNGVTNKGYWYQTGLIYDRPSNNFYILYEVWNDKGDVIEPDPTKGILTGYVPFDGKINDGDRIVIEMWIGREGSDSRVFVNGIDKETGAKAEFDMGPAHGELFVGIPYKPPFGDFQTTSVMTETLSSTRYPITLRRQEYVNLSETLPKKESVNITEAFFMDIDFPSASEHPLQARLGRFLFNSDSVVPQFGIKEASFPAFLKTPGKYPWFINESGSPTEFVTGGKLKGSN